MKDLSFCPLTSSTSSSFPVSLPRLTVSCTPARNTCKNSSHQLRSPFSALFPTTCHSFALGLNTRLFVKYYRVLVVLASGSFTPSSTHSANWHLSDLRMHSSKGVSPLLRSFQWLLITIGQLFFFFPQSWLLISNSALYLRKLFSHYFLPVTHLSSGTLWRRNSPSPSTLLGSWLRPSDPLIKKTDEQEKTNRSLITCTFLNTCKKPRKTE